MTFTTVPLVLVLVGLTCYIVLAGADFGAAIWQITAPQTQEGRRIRDFAHNVMAPVWEANHVWLIFVLTVMWTAYPAAFGSIASTLSVALILAALGIVIRGAAYAVSAGTSDPRQVRDLDVVSAVSSIVTPFALGACLGGIASGRVPYGNAEGDLASSWLNPTSAVTGALAIAISAYLAAVYLCDDAQRRGEHDLVAPYRRRALGAGTVAGLLAVAGLVVLHGDAHHLYRELIAGPGLPGVIVSGAAGVSALGLVLRRRFQLARFAAALAVAAIVAGWALAQQPRLLPGLTVDQAAAPRDTLIAVIIAVVGGGIVVIPSLLVLLRLSVAGRLGDYSADGGSIDPRNGPVRTPGLHPSRAGRLATACLIGGSGFLTI
ncbi:MAG TPA: cytochrome d ubiquinol oxidase subunit II, partial [Asanoa sp.]